MKIINKFTKAIFISFALFIQLAGNICAYEFNQQIMILDEFNDSMLWPINEKDGAYFPIVNKYCDTTNGLKSVAIDNYLKISHSYPFFNNKFIDIEVGRIIGCFEQNFIYEFYEYLKDYGKAELPPKWNAVGNYTLFKINNDVQTILFSTYANRGNAHGNVEYFTITFQKSSQKILQISDFFEDDTNLLQLIYKYLKNNFITTKEECIDEISILPSYQNYDTIIPVKDGIILIFPAGRLSSFVYGPYSVKIPIEELKSAGIKKIWSELSLE